MANHQYIDFTTLTKRKYKNKLIQPLEAEPYAERLNEYFETHDMVNVYSLALFMGMSLQRFTSNYLKSDDKTIRELTNLALNNVTTISMDNAEKYKLTIKYILSRQNVGKDFIELSDEVQEGNKASIVILPAKE